MVSSQKSIRRKMWSKATAFVKNRSQLPECAISVEERSLRAKENWSKVRNRLARFPQPDPWLKMAAEIPETSLSGPIHNLWAKERFEKCWQKDYDAFEPALQIATRLLTADHALHFWHAIFFAPRVSRENVNPSPAMLSRCPGLTVLQIESPRYLTEEQRRDTLSKFDLLSQHIRYELFPSTPTLYDAITDVSGGIYTLVGDNTFDHIVDAYRSPSPLKYQEYFLFASLLCHELAHAAQMLFAYDSPKTKEEIKYELAIEPFFANQPINELGYAWETVALGGLPFPNCNHVNDWNREICHWVSASCRSSLNRALIDVDKLTKRKSVANAENGGRSNLLTRIPLRWCYKFSTSEFWEVTVPQRGAAAFALPTNAVSTASVHRSATQSALRGYNDNYVDVGFGDLYHKANRLRFHYTRADIIALLGAGNS